MRTNENEAGDASGFATLQNTPGMGEVTMPNGDQKGSGDIWPNLMDFATWTSRKKKKKQRKKKR